MTLILLFVAVTFTLAFFLSIHSMIALANSYDTNTQLNVVQQLAHEFESTTVKLFPSDRTNAKRAVHLTLKEISLLNEEDNELAGEEFEDDRIFFKGRTQLFAVNKYLENEDLPNPIAHKLARFQNSRFMPAYIIEDSFFTIMARQRFTVKDTQSNELFEGNGEAFKTWQTLKEAAYNLTSVIDQWLDENKVRRA